MTKKWDKPELTVLVRGNAEEAVLVACKNSTVAGANSKSLDCFSGGSSNPCSAQLAS